MLFNTKRMVTTDDVLNYALVSGDRNPIHLDDTYASNSRFGSKIAHGMLIGSYISKSIALDMPGSGSIYLKQTLDFKLPVYHNSEIEIEIEVIDIKEEKQIVYLATRCFAKGKLAVDGSAIVMCIE